MIRLVILSCFVAWARSDYELISPCPRLFIYDSSRVQETSTTYNGTIYLVSEYELSGIFLRLLFDKPILQLLNTYGEIRPSLTQVPNEYVLIRKAGKLLADFVERIRFSVVFEADGQTPPQLIKITLNGRKICPESAVTTTEGPKHFTSNPLPQQHSNSLSLAAKTSSEQQCGFVKKKAVALITHGQSTSHGQWPWHAALALYREEGRSGSFNYICGGTLISPSHVLTAAHCVNTKSKYSEKYIKTSVDKLSVYLGKHLLKDAGKPVQQRDVADIHVHPQYGNGGDYFNDIAVLKLDEELEIDEYVKPCCLWEGKLDSIVNKEGTVVGWGYNEHGVISKVLMQAKMPVVPSQTCNASNPEFFSNHLSEKSYCAGFRNGTSVCNGDSGGGMVFQRPNTTVWQVRGVVSLAVEAESPTHSKESFCDTTQYVVFTDVAKYLDWINETLAK